MPYGDIVTALSTVLRIKRTLDGGEIDNLILDLEARKAAAVERWRRERWRRVVVNAANVVASCAS
jgi:hypothetical protein